MGNSFKCFSRPTENTAKASSSYPWINASPSSNRNSRKVQSPSSTPKPEIFDESFIKQQAQIASMLYHQHLQNNSDLLHPLDRSVSTKNPPKPRNFAKKSYSVSSSNPLSLQLSRQDLVRSEGSEGNNHFVLVHGGGFGAWCWYKIIALLKESSCEVDAIDLTGSGLNSHDINSISSIEEYSKPLNEFLKNLAHNKKVILVGHDLGGACVSHAMELYPSKISKAIFVAATMLTHGQSALDVFSQQSSLSNLNQRAQKFVYANGKNSTPTAIDFDKSLIDDFLFNRTPSKDIALASVSMRLVPFAPVAEKLSLSTPKYGSIPRFYVKTDVQDLAIPIPLQEAMITSDPPKQVFDIKGSDHSPFFSKPQALHRVLMQISSLSLDSV